MTRVFLSHVCRSALARAAFLFTALQIHPAAAKEDGPVAAVFTAAERAGIDPLLLTAIAFHESAMHPFALHVADRALFPESRAEAVALLDSHAAAAARGELDIGALQINTRWLPRINAAGSVHVTAADLFDPAVAATLGAGVLQHELAATKGDVWRAVARYHTGPERPSNRARGQAYAARIRRIYETLVARAQVAHASRRGPS